MIRILLPTSVAVMSFLLLPSPVHSQESRGQVETRVRMAEVELSVKMLELELKMAQLAVDEAIVEVEKIKLHVEAAQAEGDARDVRRAKLELNQATIRVERGWTTDPGEPRAFGVGGVGV